MIDVYVIKTDGTEELVDTVFYEDDAFDLRDKLIGYDDVIKVRIVYND